MDRSPSVARELARATLRAQPWGVIIAGWVLAVVLAFGFRLDNEAEVTLMALATSIGVGSAMFDPAAVFTDGMPERRRVRRARSLAPGLVASFMVWLLLSMTAAAVFDPTPAPDRWQLLVWVTITASQVAVGAVLAERSISDPGIGPAGLVAAAWTSLMLVPRFNSWLQPIDARAGWWAAILIVAILVTVSAWRDPLGSVSRRPTSSLRTVPPAGSA
ncbi:MAG TPA: hypothetical protein VJM33_04710 [Microthrixaceae bacterium]|nr:hypothetical protein [Microthrixaceae bacterium]